MNVAHEAFGINRRKLMVAGLGLLLAGCRVIPSGGGTVPDTGPAPLPTPMPTPTSTLPTDEARHRIALLVPMSGTNGAVGQ